MKRNRLGETDKVFYEIGIVALGICLAAVLLYFCTHINLLTIGYPCLFNKLTHLCCPGCGGTRAIKALLQGNIKRCFYDYPPLLFGIAVYVIFMVRCFLYIHFGVRKSKNGVIVKYFYIFIGLVFAQWIVKLVAQICYGYYWFQ